MDEISKAWVCAIKFTPYPEGASEEEIVNEQEVRLRILEFARDLKLI